MSTLKRITACENPQNSTTPRTTFCIHVTLPLPRFAVISKSKRAPLGGSLRGHVPRKRRAEGATRERTWRTCAPGLSEKERRMAELLARDPFDIPARALALCLVILPLRMRRGLDLAHSLLILHGSLCAFLFSEVGGECNRRRSLGRSLFQAPFLRARAVWWTTRKRSWEIREDCARARGLVLKFRVAGTVNKAKGAVVVGFCQLDGFIGED